MKTDRLYRLRKSDIPRAKEILCSCFEKDPLYQKLIPKDKVRLYALPGLFDCDLHEMFAACDVFSDSQEMNGLIIADDETEAYNPVRFYATEAYYALKSDVGLIRNDLTFGTFWNFFAGRKYLNSGWVSKLGTKRRIHIIYLAVTPQNRGAGMAHQLLKPVLEYADQKNLLVTLETHNPQNLNFYLACGFVVVETVKSNFDLVQYCMVRRPHTPIVNPCPKQHALSGV